MMFKVAVDFDGTLAPLHFVFQGRKPAPYKHRLRSLVTLSKHFRVYIFTGRTNLQEAEQVLQEHGILKGEHYVEITREKGDYAFFIDDAAGNDDLLDDPATVHYRIGNYISRVLNSLWPYLSDSQRAHFIELCEGSRGVVHYPRYDP